MLPQANERGIGLRDRTLRIHTYFTCIHTFLLPQANERGIGLMDRITARLMAAQLWDQVGRKCGAEVWGSVVRDSPSPVHALGRRISSYGSYKPDACFSPPASISPHTCPHFPPHTQAVFNEEVWKPSSDTYKSAHVSLRIMNLYDFVNSKTLFRTMR